MKIQTDLISGAGNTFHILYGQAEKFLSRPQARELMKATSKTVCEKQKADGFIFLEKEEGSPNQYKWYFYNNDGSEAEMCGNATRCVGFYLKNHLQSPLKNWVLATVAGPIQIETVEASSSLQEFKITMSPVQKLESTRGFFCDTGVPHLVLKYDSENLFKELTEDLKIKSRTIRFDSEFQPRGTNVTYAALLPEADRLRAVSYERGVEDFTEACGTGAMAAALYNLSVRGSIVTKVEMPGGTLTMNLSNLNRPTMTGPAQLLGSYENDISI